MDIKKERKKDIFLVNSQMSNNYTRKIQKSDCIGLVLIFRY